MQKTAGFVLLCGMLFLKSGFSQDYLERFNQYWLWKQSLPEIPDSKFIAFIKQPQPLSKKLRESWLFQLAKDEKWQDFLSYYQPSENTTLNCYAATANFKTGNITQAAILAKPLWLTGKSQPAACDELFSNWISHPTFDKSLIPQRVVLALSEQNIELSKYLLKKLPDASPSQLLNIYYHPEKLNHNQQYTLYHSYYFYGLKRMIAIDMPRAASLFESKKVQSYLTTPEKQEFIGKMALYKAIRDEPDTDMWFAKLTPDNLDNNLLHWHIRYAIKHQQWQQAVQYIERHPEREKTELTYWLARAYAMTGNLEKANHLYQKIHHKRSYYGFMASQITNLPFEFHNEKTTPNRAFTQKYKQILEQIRLGYQQGKKHEASVMTNDFASELDDKDTQALAVWLANDLQWFGKSIYITNQKKSLHNNLDLRFPVAYKKELIKFSKHHNLPVAFVYAVIRQESAFRVDAISSANARGLMQLLPATAKMIARKHSIAYKTTYDLFQPQKNITLGTAYLGHLNQKFNHLLLTTAAYNAGPNQVIKWLESQPDIEDSKNANLDVWIDTLPWRETRNYLKNIIAFYAVYQYRLGQKPELLEFS